MEIARIADAWSGRGTSDHRFRLVHNGDGPPGGRKHRTDTARDLVFASGSPVHCYNLAGASGAGGFGIRSIEDRSGPRGDAGRVCRRAGRSVSRVGYPETSPGRGVACVFAATGTDCRNAAAHNRIGFR
jgi:hypothetical protein